MRSAAPFVYAVLWSAQTVFTKLYVTRQRRSALQVFGSVAAAEITKTVANAAVCGWSAESLRARLPVCAACAVACASLTYPTLAVIPLAAYMPLLGVQLVIRQALGFAARGGAPTTRRAVGATLGCVAALVVAPTLPRWPVVAAAAQAFLVCFAEALDDDGEGVTCDPVAAASSTAWTASLLAAGAAAADPRAAALTVVAPTQPYAAATVALMAAAGVARGVAASESAWPGTTAAAEAVLLAVGGGLFLGEAVTVRQVVAGALAVAGAYLCSPQGS